MAATPAQVTVYEDSGVTLMGRVVGHDAANIQQADVSAISRNVYLNDAIVGASTAIVVATAVQDTLQTDARWTVDSTGYNFIDAVDDDVFTTGDAVYIVEYKFTPQSGADYHAMWKVHTRSLLRS